MKFSVKTLWHFYGFEIPSRSLKVVCMGKNSMTTTIIQSLTFTILIVSNKITTFNHNRPARWLNTDTFFLWVKSGLDVADQYFVRQLWLLHKSPVNRSMLLVTALAIPTKPSEQIWFVGGLFLGLFGYREENYSVIKLLNTQTMMKQQWVSIVVLSV